MFLGRDLHLELWNQAVDVPAVLIYSMEASTSAAAAGAYVEAIVGKALAWREFGLFADDFVTFDYEFFTVVAVDDPFSSKEPYGARRVVFNSEKVDESVWRLWRYVRPAVLVAQFVKTDD